MECLMHFEPTNFSLGDDKQKFNQRNTFPVYFMSLLDICFLKKKQFSGPKIGQRNEPGGNI